MFIDFHSHILPGIDDGSSSVEESIELLKMEYEQGITRVVATPHFYANLDSPEHFLEKRAKAKEMLDEALKDYPDFPEISLGAEVYFFRGISDSDALSELTIDDKRFILIEMPESPWTDSMYSELEAIYTQRGIMPIMAHMDRYIMPFKTHRIPERFEDMHVLVQANASFFLRGGMTSAMALRLLKDDKIQLIGSDCHNIKARPPKIREALEIIEKKLGADAVERINRYGRMVFGD